MSTNSDAKVVWYEKQGNELSFGEQSIPGGVTPALEHARALIRDKEIVLGQILASDGLVLVHFTRGANEDDELFKYAN